MKLITRMRKLLSAILALVMIVALVPFFSPSVRAAETGTPDTSWYTGHEDDTAYEIHTADQLAGLAQLVNNRNGFIGKTIRLTENIDLTAYGRDSNGGKGWIPIGKDYSCSFKGIFDGSNKTITGLYINRHEYFPGGYYETRFSSLFGSIVYATVKNLSVEGVSITVSYEPGQEFPFGDIGGMVGDANSSNIENCYTSGVIDAPAGMIGGVVGSASGLAIKNCYSDAAVNGEWIVGGVVGVAFHESSITNCHFTGSVDGTKIIGGVVGDIYLGTSVSDSSCTGTVTGTDYGVGGVVGDAGDMVGSDNCSVTNCYATGVVSGKDEVGGVVGRVYLCRVTNSYATGTVNGVKNVGGVAGYVSREGILTSCYALGAVSGTTHVGGVVGRGGNDAQNYDSHLNNCYSKGDITGTGDYIGGVIGELTNGSVENCYATGTISGNYYVGGIAGYVDRGGIKNCAALNSEISGTGSIGRVAGDWIGMEAVFLNNAAFSGMAGGGNGKTGNGKDGADITAADINVDGTIGGRFTVEAGWTAQASKLPGLSGTAVDMPAHLWIAPGFTGPEHMTLVVGYTPASSEAFTITSAGPVVVTIAAGDEKITWNDAAKRLDVAAGLAEGLYPVTLTASNGVLPDATRSFVLIVTSSSAVPEITGPAAMLLQEGYAAAQSDAFTVTGDPTPTVTKTAGNGKITWNGTTNRLDIAEGLWAGTYAVTLRVSLGGYTIQTLAFTLTVKTRSANEFIAPPDPPDPPESNVKKIYTAQQLWDVRDRLNGSYMLMNDIDLSEVNGGEWVPIGDNATNSSASRFSGSFEGQGYAISNLRVTGDYKYAGLFGYVSGARIRNVGLKDTHIDVTAHPDLIAGGICGYMAHWASIDNCYHKGTIRASSVAGGICGISGVSGQYTYEVGGTIRNCYNAGDVSVDAASKGAVAGGICGSNTGSIDRCFNTGTVLAISPNNTEGASSYYVCAGGIAGDIYGGSYDPGQNILNSFNTGSVTAYATKDAYAGGISGTAQLCLIEDCFNTGSVSSVITSPDSWSSVYAGGIGGNLHDGIAKMCYNTGDISIFPDPLFGYVRGLFASRPHSTVTNCYWNIDSDQIVNDAPLSNEDKEKTDNITGSMEPLTTEQMKDSIHYTGFDFDEKWMFLDGENDGYPIHRSLYYYFMNFLPPSAPQEFTATPENRQVSLSWSAPASDGGSAITSYQISKDGGVTWMTASSDTGHTFAELTNGTAYAFRVRALNIAGNGDSAAASATPRTVPGKPGQLYGSSYNGRIEFSWSPPTDNGGSPIIRYEVAIDNSEWVTAQYNTGHSFTGLTNGTSYRLWVRAVNAAGAGRSDYIDAAPYTRPSAPQNLAAASGDGQVTLSWNAPENDGGGISYYRVSSNDGSTWVTASSDTGHTFTGLTNGTVYTFKVYAVNRAGNGAQASVMATPQVSVLAPTAPQSFAATTGDGQVALSWSAPVSDGGSAITGYRVSSDNGSTWETASGSTGHTFIGLTNGTSYTFKVYAVNSAGDGAQASATATPRTVPTEPLNIKAVPGDGQVTLSWSAPASDGGSGITGYRVSKDGGSTWETASGGTGHTFIGLTNGSWYPFKVLAVNGAGNGVQAAVSATPQPIPAAPQNFTAVPGNGHVTLSWSLLPSYGGGVFYTYQVSSDNGTTWVEASNGTNHTFLDLINGRSYIFKVRGINDAGCGEAATTSAAPRTIPAAPQDLTATPGVDQVALSWRAPASDGGSPVIGYQVTFGSGSDTWVSAFANTSHTFTGLENGTSYAFRVRAVNEAGYGAETLVYATPRTVPTAPQSFTATPGNGQATLSWSAPSDHGGSEILRYQVSSDNGSTWLTASSRSGHTFTGLTNGRSYTFRVRAVNDAGYGAQASASATPQAPVTLTSITVTPPGKTTYIVGESLNTAGMRVTAHYSDGSSTTVSTGITTRYDFSTVGTKTVTVEYAGKKATFTVTVDSAVPSAITSPTYAISGGYVSRVTAGTTVTQLLNGLNERQYIKIYNGSTEVSGSTKLGTGMTVRLLDGATTKQMLTVVVKGDLTGNGTTSALGLLKLKRDILGIEALSGAFKTAADVNGDGKANALDLLVIKRDILGIEKLK